jgi:putative membrane protein
MFLVGQQGMDGFLGTRGSLMLDVVFLAMFAVLPALAASIALVKRGYYRTHKWLQVTLGIVLLVAIVAFELDMQIYGWRHRATESPYFSSDAFWSSPLGVSLAVHLFFAIPTALLWVYVIAMALWRFPANPLPNAYSHAHKKLGWLAALEMTFTALTGWLFYWMAFVATK